MYKIAILSVFSFLVISFTLKAQNNISGDTVSREIFGSITSKSGTKVKITLDKDYKKLPSVNITGELMKSFETKLLGAKVSGWLSIGEMKINNIADKIITFTLLKEMSVITENGVKKDHFITGQEVKFDWKELATPDEVLFEKGMSELDNDKFAAMEYFKRTVVINPGHAEAWNMIGMINNENKHYDSAAYFFVKAYNLDTSNLKYIKNLVVTNTNLGKYSEAYAFSSKSVLHAPKDAEAHYLRAINLLYFLNGKISASQQQQILSDLDFAVSVDEKDSFYIKERMVVRGYFHDDTGACDDAKKYKSLEGTTGEAFVKQYCKE